MEKANRVRTTADGSNKQVGQAIDAREHLCARFLADDALEITHQFRIRMRASGSADNVESVMDIGDPVAQPFIHRVL